MRRTMAFINETGNRYGRWLVIERGQNGKGGSAQWICLCDCGNTSLIRGADLRHGKTQSCGCANMENSSNALTIDLLGQRFGRLVVVKRAKNQDHDNHAYWECLCDCGSIIITSSKRLRNGTTKSCGCFRKDVLSLPNKNAALLWHYRNYTKSAKKRRIEWNISLDLFDEITRLNCYFCGTEPVLIKTHKIFSGAIPRNGIDRLDSFSGYSTDNVVPCCKTCNYAKGIMSEDEFYRWIKTAYKHLLEDGRINESEI
jgi:hypothetical protein